MTQIAAVPSTWSPGQRQALEELELIAQQTSELSVVDFWGPTDLGEAVIQISVGCGGMLATAGGIALRRRERLNVLVPFDFPFGIPRVWTPHRRWAGTPHVQWAKQLCLYMSPALEWDPSDGMFGLVERLMSWLERAAAGKTEAAGQPLHPPVAYASPDAGVVIVRANAPRPLPGTFWAGVALLRHPGADRAEVIGWMPTGAPWPVTPLQARTAGWNAMRAAGLKAAPSDRFSLATAIILPGEMGFEFPTTARALMDALRDQDAADPNQVLGLLALTAVINTHTSEEPPGQGTSTLAGYVLIGTPSRGISGMSERITHLAAWRLPDDTTPLLAATSTARFLETGSSGDIDTKLLAAGRQIQADARQWLDSATISWATLYETRPEVVVRRDAAAPARWLAGRRILILGAGAIGAPVAEACVRAGAGAVKIVDSGAVHPGILVRQPYDDADIGRSKAVVLADRLRRIGTPTCVLGEHADAATVLRLSTFDPSGLDLIIDATANRTIRVLLERQRTAARDRWPATASFMIGYQAERGIAAISLPGATGGPADVLRRLGIAARTQPGRNLTDIVEDFFPDPPRSHMFQPEPGCSDVTFTGGMAEVTALAGQLLTGLLQTLNTTDDQGRQPMSALIVRMPSTGFDAPLPGAQRLGWPNDTLIPTANGTFEVRLAAPALAEIRAEARRGARVREKQVETGGLLIGAFDDAAGIVWIDQAAGPPPDSRLAAVHFEHGLQGVQAVLDHARASTARASHFVGMWHTHPGGAAAPSATDVHGMADLLLPTAGAPRRALMLIAAAPQERWQRWLHADGTPDWYARIANRSTSTPGPSGQSTGTPPEAARWWPGGYDTPILKHTNSRTATAKSLLPARWSWWRQRRQARKEPA